jgi:hypothetical protein
MSGGTCLPEDCTVASVSWHYKYPTKCVGLVQSEYHYYIIEVIACSHHDIADTLFT